MPSSWKDLLLSLRAAYALLQVKSVCKDNLCQANLLPEDGTATQLRWGCYFIQLSISSPSVQMLWQVLHNRWHRRQVLPITVVRWTTFSNANAYVPFAATAFADTLFASSGWLNVVLFALTRPKVLPSREVIVLDTSASLFRHGQTRAEGNLVTDYSNDDIRDAVETPISASFSPRDKYNSLTMQFPWAYILEMHFAFQFSSVVDIITEQTSLVSGTCNILLVWWNFRVALPTARLLLQALLLL